MRRVIILLALAVIVAAGLPQPAGVSADEPPSISRDARGPQPVREHDPLGGPPTPRFYLLGQSTIFIAGVTLLVVAAALGAYTLVLVRRTEPRR